MPRCSVNFGAVSKGINDCAERRFYLFDGDWDFCDELLN